MTKLTLSVEEEVVEEAKRLAAENETSVSAMFSRFIRSLAGWSPSPNTLGPNTRRASGLVTLPAGKTDREALQDALLEKYGIEG